MNDFLPRRFCRRNSEKTGSLYPISFCRHGKPCRFRSTRAFLCAFCVSLVIFLFRGEEPGGRGVGRPDSFCSESGEDQALSPYSAGIEAETLFMTVYDEDGLKRLLSPSHPAILSQGLYFTFPGDMLDYEICRNDGVWKSAEEQVYLSPRKGKEEEIRVRFRAKASDGELRYSRSFVLMGSK